VLVVVMRVGALDGPQDMAPEPRDSARDGEPCQADVEREEGEDPED
jgi:hypothetical protein